jgi:hypothetical protein
MKKNRKKAETYRFNGLWGMEPVRSDELRQLIRRFRNKLGNPFNPDARKWTARWLVRFQREYARKLRSLARKQLSREKDRRRRAGREAG